ncbi:GntR family transcriptional regulator [Frondihabitans cladoniiphilus]|uniref:HTH gntR-type domain-containing protein n=1 Tax=Frondihabitans cladoniiphilus TaxID=715785 RepID=A0ABP8VY50_9MICO
MPVPISTPSGIRRRLRKDEVFDRLLDAILDGTLLPGERIRDVDLQEWFGVSRTPIRLAIDRLEELRLVESRPNRYTRVAEVTPRRIPQATDVMCALWRLAVQLSVTRLTDDQVADSRARLAKASAICRSHEGADATGLVEEIRHALFFFSEHSGNRLLAEMVVKLGVSLRFQASKQGLLLDGGLLACVFDDLAAAVADRDEARAAAVFSRMENGAFFLPAGRGAR